LASFLFCEKQYLHFTTLVFGHSAITVIRLNRFFHLGKNCNRSDRFFAILAAEKIGDSQITSDMKLGPQTHLGAESQS